MPAAIVPSSAPAPEWAWSWPHADRAIRFVEALRFTSGVRAGGRFLLEPWQLTFLTHVFGRVKPDGLRVTRTAYLEVPRKNGKTEFAAAIALYMLIADGEAAPQVYSAASDREQASLVFAPAKAMVESNARLRKECRVIESTRRIVYRGGYYRALSSDVRRKHGFNAHCVVYDELHTATDRGLRDVLASSMGARAQPLMLEITTAGYDRESICWEEHEYARRVIAGEIVDPTFFGMIFAAPMDADWREPRIWAIANPNLNVSLSEEFLASECVHAQEVPAFQNTFRRLYLNQWTQQDERWLDMTAWDQCGTPYAESELSGRPCYAGLDLASTTDIAAFAMVFPPPPVGPDCTTTEPYRLVLRFFIPRDTMRAKELRDRVPYSAWEQAGYVVATEGNVIDYTVVKATILELAKQFDVREVAYDRWGAVQITTELAAEGMVVVPFGQGFASMSAPSKELERLVLQGRIWHGGHPVLRWMADNVQVRIDPAGNLKPDKARSREKIDGIVALVMALDRAVRNAGPTAGPDVDF
jgi:phage terminase large subunit-like protein